VCRAQVATAVARSYPPANVTLEFSRSHGGARQRSAGAHAKEMSPSIHAIAI